MIAENVEGRERYPINVRYDRDFRDNVEELQTRADRHALGRADSHLRSGEDLLFARAGHDSRRRRPAHRLRLHRPQHQRLRRLRREGRAICCEQKLTLPPGFTYKWSGEYEFELRAKQRLKLILPVVFFVIFLLLYMVFHSVTEAVVLIFPTLYAMTGGLILQWLLGYNFSVAVWVGYIALFGIAVETGVVMVVYLHEALDRRLQVRCSAAERGHRGGSIEGAVQRLRPKLMTVCAVLASLVPILWETGIGSDVMKPIAAPIVGGMITSTIHVLILVPVFFALMKERALRRGTLGVSEMVASERSETM